MGDVSSRVSPSKALSNPKRMFKGLSRSMSSKVVTASKVND